MSKTTKMIILFVMLLAVVLLVPTICNAADVKEVSTADNLKTEIASANAGDTIKLSENITLNANISIDKDLIIDGNGKTITGSGTWEKNDSLFTVTKNGSVEFKNITLTNAPKYGVQAFEGTAIFTGVTIEDCKYGGVLVNGGTAKVNSLHLGYNGESSNNGIELDQNSSTTSPKLIVNGTLTSTEKEDVVRASTNAKTKEVIIENTNNAESSVFISDGKIIVADENGKVISESTIGEGIEPKVDYTEGAKQKILLTIVTNSNKIDVAVEKGTSITSKFVEEHITLAKGYVIEGIFIDKDYSKAFNFENKINEDTTIYVKVALEKKDDNTIAPSVSEEPTDEEKDDTPKTGVNSYLGIATALIAISSVSIIALKKKEA